LRALGKSATEFALLVLVAGLLVLFMVLFSVLALVTAGVLCLLSLMRRLPRTIDGASS
jgi:hypothetical protein